ncbi:ribonuclease P protein component [Ornithobacterium rhinotracheale]|uniref:ribonuclease P protein component n=1 Tax=Ornithobacterium rhinotracheale TaxID=28251 RepID=UPI00129CF975|nr:ribonuclease P protein component [Ornithobacterium rhinotracheale]MRI62798.1 ribonuclease P protein component [Ornithobacterium rhinotracheale]MRJ08211.1 ribonuclease P protein component [Ornithobacterium rhinotracheale]UOH77408.1 ribonuclease P protein component [Ornithobacterium rhinotracheale]
MSSNVENTAKERFLFRKKSKLKRKKWIEILFSEGKSVKNYPLKAIFTPLAEGEASMIGVSVPKKLFKHATDRNHIKRLMREAYRLNQSMVENSYAVMFIYISGKKTDFDGIFEAMKSILKKIEESDT